MHLGSPDYDPTVANLKSDQHIVYFKQPVGVVEGRGDPPRIDRLDAR